MTFCFFAKVWNGTLAPPAVYRYLRTMWYESFHDGGCPGMMKNHALIRCQTRCHLLFGFLPHVQVGWKSLRSG